MSRTRRASRIWPAQRERVMEKSMSCARGSSRVTASKKYKTCSTEPSHVVPHHSTTSARWSLTSLFGWEAVTLHCVAACTAGGGTLHFIPLTYNETISKSATKALQNTHPRIAAEQNQLPHSLLAPPRLLRARARGHVLRACATHGCHRRLITDIQ